MGTDRGAWRRRLAAMDDWDDALMDASGLPGPRADLELAQAVADAGDERRFLRYAGIGADMAPTNDPREFLALCGVMGIGRLVAEGREDLLPVLRTAASDSRWRVREGVAMGLQRIGDADMSRLLAIADAWSVGTQLEQRAAIAGVCEPRLLKDPAAARAALALLDRVTALMGASDDRRSDGFRALRKALGYAWSVAVAALPDAGRVAFERWCANQDADVRWVLRQNLGKDRLRRMDAAWVARWREVVG
jgi:hypothetical protein